MTDTKSALATAQQNETNAREAFNSANAALCTAQGAREAMITDAAAGKPIPAQSIRQAEEATRRAEIDAEVAGRVLAAAFGLREKAQIDAWQDEAAELQGAIDSAIEARLAAGAAVDEQMAAVRNLLEKHKLAGNELRATLAAANLFNGQREARRATNAVLRARIATEGFDDPVIRRLPKLLPAELKAFLYPAGGWSEFASSPVASAKIL